MTQKDSSGAITRSGFEMGKLPEQEQLVTHAIQNGGQVYDEPFQGKSLVNQPAFVEALTWFLDLQRKYQVAPKTGNPDAAEHLLRVCRYRQSPTSAPGGSRPSILRLPRNMPDKLGLRPALKPGKRVGIMNADGTLSVYAKTQKQDAALQFLKTYAKPVELHRLPHAGQEWELGTFSGRKSMDQQNQWLIKQPLLWNSAFHDALNNGWGDYTGGAHTDLDMSPLWKEALQRAVDGNSADTDKQAMDWLAGQMDQVTQRYLSQKPSG